MPVVFRQDGFRFHFYSNEGDPREAIHIHVVKAEADAKFWLYPEVTVAYNHGFDARVQSELSRIIEARRTDIEEAWHEHFDSSH
jgi:Domain of unknown function (DUF4160)